MNRVLIAGASSFVGANLIYRFKRLGYKILVIDHSEANLWRLTDLALSVDVSLVDFKNLSAMTDIVESFSPEFVINTFTYGCVRAQNNVEKIYKINFEAPVALLKACYKTNLKAFVHVGSSEEYGCSDGRLDENTLPRPITNYGASKAMFSMFALKHTYAQEMPVYVVRPFTLLGDFAPKDKLIGSLFLSSYYNFPVTLREPENIRDFLHVDDLINGILLICQKRPTSNYLFNVGSEQGYKINDVVSCIEKVLGRKLMIKSVPCHQACRENCRSPQVRIADSSLAKSVLGWSAKYSLEQAIQATKFWFDEHYQLYQSEQKCNSEPMPTLF